MDEECATMIGDRGHVICERALKFWKPEAQIAMFFEEAGEFMTAFHQYKRKRIKLETVIGELCDLMIMSEQMSIFLGEKDVKRILDHKLDKLQQHLDRAKENESVQRPTQEG